MTNKERLAGLKGREYYAEFHRIWDEQGESILATLKAWRNEHHRVTPVMLGALAHLYDLPLKSLWEQLEYESILPTGTYDRCVEGGMKAGDIRKQGEEWLKSRA